MKHLGDITQINGSMVEPVNVIIGGSPCQDLSVAGRRAGLAGERSGLFMRMLWQRYRTEQTPMRLSCAPLKREYERLRRKQHDRTGTIENGHRFC